MNLSDIVKVKESRLNRCYSAREELAGFFNRGEQATNDHRVQLNISGGRATISVHSSQLESIMALLERSDAAFAREAETLEDYLATVRKVAQAL